MAEKRWKCTVCGYIHHGKQPPDVCPVCGAGKYRFILDEPVPPELEQMLKIAFAEESKANVRNLAFARRAEQDGFPQVARLFRAVADAERVHAQEYLNYLEGAIGSTGDNLVAAFENEIKANAEGYAPLIKKAIEQKREDVTWSFARARDVEAHHARLYKVALSALASEREVTYHVCQVCGFVFDGALPDECPICLAKPKEFKLVN